MKITALVENTSRLGFNTEHGLCLYIEALNKKILFDTGASDLFYKNALDFGIDLSLVDFLIISHGHNDHGGGISKFLEINSTAPVYISEGAFIPRYNAKGKYIGLNAELLSSNRLVFLSSSAKIDTGITVLRLDDENLENPVCSFGLTSAQNGVKAPDTFPDEQYLEILENENKVLISGCSHRGILNIARAFSPTHLIGGFHISKLPLGSELLSLGADLDGLNTRLYTCHCTGVPQYEFLSKASNKINYISCGDTLEI